VGGNTYERGRVGEERGGKETDGCPFTATYVTAPSVLPSEVVSLVDLTRMSSDDEEVGNLMEDPELGVSKDLGISLSKVHAWYFQDSDEGEDGKVGRESISERDY
jgi:hypothetical protein